MGDLLVFSLLVVLSSLSLIVGIRLSMAVRELRFGGAMQHRSLQRQLMTLLETVTAVASGLSALGTATENLAVSVNEVLEDLKSGGQVAEAIPRLEEIASGLNAQAEKVNTAAQSLSAADPTPPTDAPPGE